MPIHVPSPFEIAGLVALAAFLLGFRVWLGLRPWIALARKYPHTGLFPDATITALGAEVDGLVPRDGVVLGVDLRGLHVRNPKGGHRALVPWPAIQADLWTATSQATAEAVQEGGAARAVVRALQSRHSGAGLPASLLFGPEGDHWIYLPLPAAQELADLATDVWPGSRKLRAMAREGQNDGDCTAGA